MASYFDETRQEQYVAVVMEVAEVASREGWKLRGSDQNAIKADILQRFKCGTMPELAELVDDAGAWTLYPIYKLPPKGQWTSVPGQSCILLGDAAHAVSTLYKLSEHLIDHQHRCLLKENRQESASKTPSSSVDV